MNRFASTITENSFGRERNSIPKPERLGKRFCRFVQKIPPMRRFFLSAAQKRRRASLRQRARSENHAAGEKTPCRRQGVERGQPRATHSRERRKGIREDPDQKIGESDSRVTIETTVADVAREKTRRADFFLDNIKQHLSQF
ncbi:MAG: hypothetical protein E6H80_12310, partial [Betaproteobacteria bacterium]